MIVHFYRQSTWYHTINNRKIIIMGQNLHIKLTKLTPKLPEAAVSSLLERAESYKAAQAEAG